ncbi:NAD(P)-dependent oxidoreductase [Patescibacteria group bacterium]|nr:NAD(P)-dependent oxidoreductase [Patescibacteria group bacterium]
MKQNRKTIFLTGGAGFIGANIVKYFAERNYKVIILIRKKTDLWRLKGIKKITFCYGDLSDTGFLKKELKKSKPQYILNCASYGNYPNQENSNRMIETNIMGLNNLLNASLNINYKAFIAMGTSSEYGYKNKPMSELDAIDPQSFYAATKASATLLARFFSKEYNKPIYILRLFSIFGPYEEKTRLIPTVIKNVLNNETVNLTPKTVRHDFIYIDDLIKAIEKIIKNKKKLKNGEIINIGSGKQFSNEEVVKAIEKITKTKININKNFPNRKWDTGYWLSNTKKSYKLLGWKPQYTMEEGLSKTIDWFKNNK